VHEELVDAIRLGDPDRAKAAISAHRGESADHGADPAAATTDAADLGSAAGERDRIAALERENRELRQAANTLLKSASAFFDPRS
jgi:hypothetical protein